MHQILFTFIVHTRDLQIPSYSFQDYCSAESALPCIFKFSSLTFSGLKRFADLREFPNGESRKLSTRHYEQTQKFGSPNFKAILIFYLEASVELFRINDTLKTLAILLALTLIGRCLMMFKVIFISVKIWVKKFPFQ